MLTRHEIVLVFTNGVCGEDFCMTMSMFRHRSAARRTMAVLVSATFLHACTSWHHRPIGTPEQRQELAKAIEARTTVQARATLTDSSVRLFSGPVIQRDTLWGSRLPTDPAAPLAGISVLELRQTDNAKTLILIVAIGAAVASVFGYYLGQDLEKSWNKR
jgi:hypothetical protein